MSRSARRTFLRTAAALPLVAAVSTPRAWGGTATGDPGPLMDELKPLTGGAQPISVAERRLRIEKVQRLMEQRKVAALLLEPGASMEYFTGIRWHRSERTTAAIIPARGEVVVVTPAFEAPSVRETLQVNGEVLPWDEHESPFVRIVQGLRDALGRLRRHCGRADDAIFHRRGRAPSVERLRDGVGCGTRLGLQNLQIAGTSWRSCKRRTTSRSPRCATSTVVSNEA